MQKIKFVKSLRASKFQHQTSNCEQRTGTRLERVLKSKLQCVGFFVEIEQVVWLVCLHCLWPNCVSMYLFVCAHDMRLPIATSVHSEFLWLNPYRMCVHKHGLPDTVFQWTRKTNGFCLKMAPNYTYMWWHVRFVLCVRVMIICRNINIIFTRCVAFKTKWKCVWNSLWIETIWIAYINRKKWK